MDVIIKIWKDMSARERVEALCISALGLLFFYLLSWLFSISCVVFGGGPGVCGL